MPPSASRAPRSRGGIVVVGGDVVDGVSQNSTVILGILGFALLCISSARFACCGSTGAAS